jgi:hypothetical protein
VLQQLTLVTTDPGSDGLPSGVSHSVAARCSKSWLLVPSGDSGPEEDLYDGLELHPPWMRDFLDPVPGGGGDAQVFQQSLKPAGGAQSFNPDGLHLVRISVHLLILRVARGKLLFISLVFYAMVPQLLLLLSW